MASRYWVTGGDGNWGSTNNWSTTSGGGGGSAVPLATDDVFFDANSPNCTVNTSNRVALSLKTTGYTNTISMGSLNITVSGALTLGTKANHITATTGRIVLQTAATHTSSGVTIPNLQFQGNVTHVLADNFNVTNLYLGNASNGPTINSSQISVSGNLDMSPSSTGTLTGSSVIVMAGTGNVVFPTSTGVLRSPLTINTSGTITFASGTFRYNTGTLTYTAGTVVASSTTFDNVSVAVTLATGTGITWSSMNLTGSVTVTNNADSYTNALKLAGTTNALVLTGNKFYVAGSVTNNVTSGTVSGTAEIIVTNTATLSAPSITTGKLTCLFTINAPSKTVTVSTGFAVDLGKFKWVAGTVAANGNWPSGNSIAANPIAGMIA